MFSGHHVFAVTYMPFKMMNMGDAANLMRVRRYIMRPCTPLANASGRARLYANTKPNMGISMRPNWKMGQLFRVEIFIDVIEHHQHERGPGIRQDAEENTDRSRRAPRAEDSGNLGAIRDPGH